MRPITLLNTDYKLVEKVLANRLKPALELLINEDQKGFMSNRCISANIRRILDLVENTDDNTPAAILSIDAEKAFDKIDIEALIKSLEFFNIGPEFRKWTEVCFKNSRAVVMNNGFKTKEIKIERGVKQGGCCSAYYFLVIAEILAIHIREESNLIGIDIGEIHRLLGQYADDMDLYLWGSKRNINNALYTLKALREFSGFTINVAKTSLLKLGAAKTNEDLTNFASNIKEANYINVLGVEVSNKRNDDSLNNINYSPLINKAHGILNVWKHRGLSLLGKIMIVNTLVGSLFVYKMSVLPLISHNTIKDLTTLITNFIWCGRKPKIRTEILMLDKIYGGAGLVNLKLKDQALKIAWIKRINQDSMLSHFTFLHLGNIGDLIWQCNINEKDINKKFTKSFWRDVLAAWSLLNFKDNCLEYPEIMNQVIWYNSKIKINHNVCFFPAAFNSGLRYVYQMVGPNGKMLSTQSLMELYDLTVLQANGLISSIPQSWKRTIQENASDDFTDYEHLVQKIYDHAHPTAWFYKTVNKKYGAVGIIMDKWRTLIDIEIEDIEVAVRNIYKITNHTKLRSFQFRMLHKAIILKDQLVHWKITEDNQCFNCKCAKESIIHLFAECPFIKKIYTDIQKYLKEEWNKECEFSNKNIILNTIHSDPTDISNFLLLVTKQELYSNRCMRMSAKFKNTPAITAKQIIEKFKNYEKYERYNAIHNNKLAIHLNKWQINYNSEITTEDYVMKHLDQL